MALREQVYFHTPGQEGIQAGVPTVHFRADPETHKVNINSALGVSAYRAALDKRYTKSLDPSVGPDETNESDNVEILPPTVPLQPVANVIPANPYERDLVELQMLEENYSGPVRAMAPREPSREAIRMGALEASRNITRNNRQLPGAIMRHCMGLGLANVMEHTVQDPGVGKMAGVTNLSLRRPKRAKGGRVTATLLNNLHHRPAAVHPLTMVPIDKRRVQTINPELHARKRVVGQMAALSGGAGGGGVKGPLRGGTKITEVPDDQYDTEQGRSVLNRPTREGFPDRTPQRSRSRSPIRGADLGARPRETPAMVPGLADQPRQRALDRMRPGDGPIPAAVDLEATRALEIEKIGLARGQLANPDSAVALAYTFTGVQRQLELPGPVENSVVRVATDLHPIAPADAVPHLDLNAVMLEPPAVNMDFDHTQDDSYLDLQQMDVYQQDVGAENEFDHTQDDSYMDLQQMAVPDRPAQPVASEGLAAVNSLERELVAARDAVGQMTAALNSGNRDAQGQGLYMLQEFVKQLNHSTGLVASGNSQLVQHLDSSMNQLVERVSGALSEVNSDRGVSMNQVAQYLSKVQSDMGALQRAFSDSQSDHLEQVAAMHDRSNAALHKAVASSNQQTAMVAQGMQLMARQNNEAAVQLADDNRSQLREIAEEVKRSQEADRANLLNIMGRVANGLEALRVNPTHPQININNQEIVDELIRTRTDAYASGLMAQGQLENIENAISLVADINNESREEAEAGLANLGNAIKKTIAGMDEMTAMVGNLAQTIAQDNPPPLQPQVQAIQRVVQAEPIPTPHIIHALQKLEEAILRIEKPAAADQAAIPPPASDRETLPGVTAPPPTVNPQQQQPPSTVGGPLEKAQLSDIRVPKNSGLAKILAIPAYSRGGKDA